jgi:hypothetical protein
MPAPVLWPGLRPWRSGEAERMVATTTTTTTTMTTMMMTLMTTMMTTMMTTTMMSTMMTTMMVVLRKGMAMMLTKTGKAKASVAGEGRQ